MRLGPAVSVTVPTRRAGELSNVAVHLQFRRCIELLASFAFFVSHVYASHPLLYTSMNAFYATGKFFLLCHQARW
jgi:hypothetical protein